MRKKLKSQVGKKKAMRQRKELLANLEVYGRGPFQTSLADLLECGPSKEDLMQFAAAFPDKWASAVSIFARLSGYKDETVVDHKHAHLHVMELSDAELHQRLHNLRNLGEPILGKSPIGALALEAPKKPDEKFPIVRTRGKYSKPSMKTV